MFTHYDALHLTEDASPEVIKAAYKALAQKWHPDKHPGNNDHAELRFKAITAAYEVLSDPLLRASYDEEIRVNRNGNPPPPEPAQEEEADHTKANSIVQNLMDGHVPIWKIVWLYMTAIPLIACIAYNALGNVSDVGNLFMILGVIAYECFIHICLWRTASRRPFIWQGAGIKAYILLVLFSPIIVFLFYYVESMRAHENSYSFIDNVADDKSSSQYSSSARNYETAKHTSNFTTGAETKRNESWAQPLDEKQKFDIELAAVYAKFPFLDVSRPDANQRAINEVLQSVKRYQNSGFTSAEALRRAVSDVAPGYVRNNR